MYDLKESGVRTPWASRLGTALLWLCACSVLPGNAQTALNFNSGSDGSDGALNLTTGGTVVFFDPASVGRQLDPDGDGIYHFTTINIASGVTVDMTSSGHGPVIWLATGAVRIDGLIDLNGRDGHGSGSATSNTATSQPGAGGFAGGHGARAVVPAQPGKGPGGGRVHSVAHGGGGGAGHAGAGGNGFGGGILDGGGRVYGNVFLLPLIGGSGGAGGGVNGNAYGSGGGAGGGAILIASTDSIRVNGIIRAVGGNGGGYNFFDGPGGGGGSGGSIRLIAPVVSGSGTLAVNGGIGTFSGSQPGGSGAPGRIRIEALQAALTGPVGPAAIVSTPGIVFLPANRHPVRIVRIGNTPVPDTITGSLTRADVVLEAITPTTVDIAARGVPLGTVVRVTVLSDSLDPLTFDSTPLAGTIDASTATATVTIPHGFTQFLVEAMWTP